MPVYATNAPHDGFGFGIIKMPTVPSQKIIDAVYHDTVEVSMYTVFLSIAIRFRSE